jgi:tRNA 2-selenouridine synthase
MRDEITIEELLQLRESAPVTTIDVRSPSEFADGTIPGSVNIPLFDDEERAQVGTVYKQIGVKEAKRLGLEIVSRKLPELVGRFERLEGEKAVFCWRGGMRSKSVTTVLSLMGIRAYRIIGGYRAYRRKVVESLEQFDLKPECIVVGGLTGTGKTRVLRLLKSQGYPVLDLERMAGHRGSVFGHVGLRPNNQKTFDALLFEELRVLNHRPYVLMEGESRRIGKAVMPEFLARAKESGRHIHLVLPLEARVRNILADYDPSGRADELLAAFRRIKPSIHTPVARDIEQSLAEARYEDAVRLLLQFYYDRKYGHAMDRSAAEPVTIEAADVRDAAEKVRRQLAAWGFGDPETPR